MKQIFLYLLIASLFLGFASCIKSNDPDAVPDPEPEEHFVKPEPEKPEPAEPIILTTKQSEKVNIDNLFAFKIFKEVSAASGPNTFFSPLSLTMALGMLYNGTSGDTRTEMAEALGMGDFSETEINEYYQEMMQALLNIDPLTDIGIANSIWHRIGFPVKQPFIEVNQKCFDAMVKALDFSNPDAADIINGWCAEKTKDRIKEIIAPPIPNEAVMYLINALYFKSKWLYEFEKKKTKQDDFVKTDNRKVKVNMMEQTAALPYYADKYLQCVEMPYGNQAFSMVAILPADGMNIDQLIDYLDDTSWQNIVNNLHEQNVWLKLPRFKIECDIPLNNPVINVGISRIFGGGLKNISDAELAVSNIKQKTFVEVNEEGTEAAAVTVIEIIAISAIAPKPIPFFANRPFLYLIKEKSTGAILFIGRMDEPE
jgi:serpin B